MSKKHEHYELLNLLGYSLAKFDMDFVKEFGFNTRQSFFDFFVKNNIVKTASVVKNRMDLFDYFFPNNSCKGWWQKGDAYIYRKIFLDSLFGNENVHGLVNVVKLILREQYNLDLECNVSAILESKFRKMQSTGLEAELYFKQNYKMVKEFKNGICEDARLYGDGYDFLIKTQDYEYLCEIKGLRTHNGNIRMTQNEYEKALKFKENYLLVIIANLEHLPKIISVKNPLTSLQFKEKIVISKETKEYQSYIC